MGSIGPIGLVVVMHHTGQYLKKVEKGGAADIGETAEDCSPPTTK